MKLAVVCANGKARKLIVEKAVNRGIDVTAVVRGTNKTKAPHTITKDILEIKAEDLKGFDVVVDAFGALTPECASTVQSEQRETDTPAKA